MTKNAQTVTRDAEILAEFQQRTGYTAEWLIRTLNGMVRAKERKALADKKADALYAKMAEAENRGKVCCGGKVRNDKGKIIGGCGRWLNPLTLRSAGDEKVVCPWCGERNEVRIEVVRKQ